jgi:hypothetical protein
MNNERITAALASLEATCIVMNKGARDHSGAKALLQAGNPMPTEHLPFYDMAKPTPDGSRPVMSPYGLFGETVETLGPVRAAGWRGDRLAPLLHAKLLVLGDAIVYEDDEGPDFGVHFSFTPKQAWLGSANWTKGAAEHLEFGLWTTDSALVDWTYRFVLDVIRFSEPFDTAADHPEPELVGADWDDAAFAEAIADQRLEEEYDGASWDDRGSS